MKLLIDMNLSPAWAQIFRQHGFEAEHWSTIGAHDAADEEIMKWAADHEAVVFTHDLDFGMALALTRGGGPSVIQARTQDVSPEHLGSTVIAAFKAHRDALSRGALITVDEARSRVRILPIDRKP